MNIANYFPIIKFQGDGKREKVAELARVLGHPKCSHFCYTREIKKAT